MLYAILHALHSFGDILFQSPGTIPLNGLCFDLFGLVLSHKSVLIFYPHSHVHCSLSYVQYMNLKVLNPGALRCTNRFLSLI